jgi:hypothetical protein
MLTGFHVDCNVMFLYCYGSMSIFCLMVLLSVSVMLVYGFKYGCLYMFHSCCIFVVFIRIIYVDLSMLFRKIPFLVSFAMSNIILMSL